jgi:subtilisin family serine protease
VDSKATSTSFYIDTITGTSAAAPLVSGTAALIRSVKPDWSARQVRDRILESVDLIEPGVSVGQFGKLGRGRLNAGRALNGIVERTPLTPRRASGVWRFLEL